ncbi:MAG TPA: bifunctional diaminohydroxyphosphoribosylaminopyrimidine deaminase/5-amino-6-(5-phosphoribosylamino)uracil reductase RibD, partial [Clostridiales bacterium]|nr:bifunctional diaminohydroxyphosphoribosylaminopyrimidine deaminase/5-amino-6-(5-phosphoribosylamino)uracil reductase RibD [Clostridiales bacterium]
MIDPNPKVSGRGIEILRNAGTEVVTGVLEEEAKHLNEVFIHYITGKRPFVILKTAMTLDGKIAAATGDSKWITGTLSREYVHKLRERVSAVLVGIRTVLADDPSLTTRLEGRNGRNPVRIIVDSTGRIPLGCNVLNRTDNTRIIVASTSRMDTEKEAKLINIGVEIIKSDGPDGKIDLARLLEELHRQELDSVLLEGGGTLNASALMNGLVDKVLVFIAPKIIGGAKAPTPVEGKGIRLMKDALSLENIHVSMCGTDILIEGYPKGG